MKKLALVRHGDYYSDGDLTPVGFERIMRTAIQLVKLVEPPIKIACSVQLRAKNSAAIIAEILDPINTSYHDELATGKDAPVAKYARVNMDAIHKVVESLDDNGSSIVLVTHYEVCAFYPDYFLSQILKLDTGSRPIEKGRALIIDCESGECTYI